MKYIDNILLLLAVVLGLMHFNNAQADAINNLSIGPLPASVNYGNTFASASSTPFMMLIILRFLMVLRARQPQQ